MTKYRWVYLLLLVSVQVFSQNLPDPSPDPFPVLSFNVENASEDWGQALIRANQSWFAQELYLKKHLGLRTYVLADGILYSRTSKEIGSILQLKPESRKHYSRIKVIRWITPVSGIIGGISFLVSFPLFLADLDNSSSEPSWSTLSLVTGLSSVAFSWAGVYWEDMEYRLAFEAYMHSR